MSEWMTAHRKELGEAVAAIAVAFALAFAMLGTACSASSQDDDADQQEQSDSSDQQEEQSDDQGDDADADQQQSDATAQDQTNTADQQAAQDQTAQQAQADASAQSQEVIENPTYHEIATEMGGSYNTELHPNDAPVTDPTLVNNARSLLQQAFTEFTTFEAHDFSPDVEAVAKKYFGDNYYTTKLYGAQYDGGTFNPSKVFLYTSDSAQPSSLCKIVFEVDFPDGSPMLYADGYYNDQEQWIALIDIVQGGKRTDCKSAHGHP